MQWTTRLVDDIIVLSRVYAEVGEINDIYQMRNTSIVDCHLKGVVCDVSHVL